MNSQTKVSDMTAEHFEGMAAYLEEFAKGDPSFPAMTCILQLVRHCRDLRDLCAELSIGLDDDSLNDWVSEALGEEKE